MINLEGVFHLTVELQPLIRIYNLALFPKIKHNIYKNKKIILICKKYNLFPYIIKDIF